MNYWVYKTYDVKKIIKLFECQKAVKITDNNNNIHLSNLVLQIEAINYNIHLNISIFIVFNGLYEC